jgi:hypothetical protein
MLNFRAHHFLCTLCFKGKGYSQGFIRNYKEIVERLKSESGDETPIQVTAKTDSICTACPHVREKTCATEEKIQKLDNAHAKALGLKEGDVIEWGKAKKLIAEKIDLNTFKEICAPCSWQKLGICEGVVKNIRNLKNSIY